LARRQQHPLSFTFSFETLQMKKTLSMMCSILVLLSLMDLSVAGVLAWSEERGKFASLVRYFEYGRSVPGKLSQWETNPDMRGNLYDVAWRSDVVARSSEKFAQEDINVGPVVRSYGMSFINNILTQARRAQPALVTDLHSGPGAPPNFTYSVFVDDAQNRRPGDVVVFGILSSAIPAMAALSNRTWAFEQPAPFTYPVFLPDGDGLRRIDPLINSASAERALRSQPEAEENWQRQLSQEDFFFSSTSFGATWLDHSPFARLVRRSAAINHVEHMKTEILSHSYPHDEVLRRMIASFAETARSEGQIPIIMLVQSRDRTDANVLEIAKPVLERDSIPYFATAEHFDPHDPSGFRGDGHYRPEIDRRFGVAFVALLDGLNISARE
jgi:hypothetical protein